MQDCWTGVDPDLFEHEVEHRLYTGLMEVHLANWRAQTTRTGTLVLCRRPECPRCKILRRLMTEEELARAETVSVQEAYRIYLVQNPPREF